MSGLGHALTSCLVSDKLTCSREFTVLIVLEAKIVGDES